MTQDLAGQHILMQVVPYFGYDQVLAQALRDRGAIVDILVDRPFDSAFLHGVAKVARKVVLGHATRLYRGQLEAWIQLLVNDSRHTHHRRSWRRIHFFALARASIPFVMSW